MGGATVAKYLRLWGDAISVTLVERMPTYTSNIMSSLVLTGQRTMSSLSFSYDTLRSKYGITTVFGEVVGIDPVSVKVTLADGTVLTADRIVMAPGISFDDVPGLGTSDKMPHAWQAGPQTALLASQINAMPSGGVMILTIPKTPYRCPPGPYERACLVASYFKQHKPKSKVIILDANEEVASKKDLFTKAWADLFSGIVEYRPENEVKDVEPGTNTAVTEFDKLKADVLNVIPPQRAGAVATKSGLRLINNRWVDVNWLTMESTSTPNVHVLGDAVFPAPVMPKSGNMANQQGKLAAAALLNLLAGRAPNPAPVVMNTCYSFVDAKNVIHVASVHQFDADKKQPMPVQGAGGVSAMANELEGKAALAWARKLAAQAPPSHEEEWTSPGSLDT